MTRRFRQTPDWCRMPGALFILLTLFSLFTISSANAQDFEIFAPIAAAKAPADFLTGLKARGALGDTQTLNDLSADRQAAIRAVDAARTDPSMATAVALLAHFETLSGKTDAPFRLALIDAALPAFLMADAAKYELIIETNKRLHKQSVSVQSDQGIAVSIRVGSTGARLAQWQQWVAAKRPVDGKWTYVDPFGIDPPKSFIGMPIDRTYQDTKLFSADDDITNWATAAAREKDPLANEKVNGKAAAEVFAGIAAEHLQSLPRKYLDDLPGRNTRISPSVMQVEFLSPTKAVSIMANARARQEQGWQANIDLGAYKDFLGAKVLSEAEKYNGLYAEEQLHKWGMDKGYVSEDVLNPLGSAKTYNDSATNGKLSQIVSSDVFPDGHMDPFGWMATNYRQIFVTHAGDLDSVAKYTLRMIDWWENVGLNRDDLRQLARDTPGVDAATIGSFDALASLADGLRNAKSSEAKEQAIKDAGGAAKALADLKGLNTLMMVTGQRKHLEKMTLALTEILRKDAASRTLGDRLKKPLSFDDILSEANRRGAANTANDDPYLAFRTIVDAYANGYGNLPTEVALAMAQDMAQFVDQDYLRPDGAGQLSAELRLALLPVLQETTARARSVGSDLRADAAGLANLAKIAETNLTAAISAKLTELNEPDLRGYLVRLQKGELTTRQVRIAPIEAGGWPRLQVVSKIQSPAAVAADMQRIMWLGETLGWSDKTFAHRLAAYFNGPDYRVPTVPGTDPPARRAYADDALEGFLGLSRMLSGAREAVVTVALQGPGGQDVTREFIGTRLADPTLNMALITFEHAVRGGEAAQKVLGLKGDIESLTNFGKTLKGLTVPGPGMDRAAKAKMLATLAADGYGSFSAIVQNFGNKDWTDWLDANMGGNSTVLGKFGGTTGVLLATADDAFQSQESQQALYGAFITDLLVLWQPEIAAFMALNSMYQLGNQYLVTNGAKSDLIDLLVANGKWDFSNPGKPPVLLSVQVGDRVITDDPAARAQQCSQRRLRSILPKNQSNDAVGIFQLLKIPPKSEAGGVPLCGSGDGGSCVPDNTRLVKPREAAMLLFDAAPFKSTDPIILAIKDSINARVGWWTIIDPLRQLIFDDGTSWTAERLASHDIYPPTPEDSAFVLRESVEVKSRPADFSNRPKDADAQWIHAGVWQSMSAGGRKMLGYNASEYWVRRQYLMECVMLGPILKEAGRKAQKADYTDIQIGDVAGRLASLDKRVRAIDARIWPNIALSYQPYPIDPDMPTYPADQQLAIYDHYLNATTNPRVDLRDLIAWFTEGPQVPQNLPMDLIQRAWDNQNSGVSVDASSYQNFFAGLRKTNEDGMNFAVDLLKRRVENLLSDITVTVEKYEDGFDQALARISGINQFVAAADGYTLLPAHVALMPEGSFNPPNGKYGNVEDHLFPKGRWQGDSLFSSSADNALLTSLNIRDLSLVSDGSVGANLREWEDGYKQVKDDARDELALTLAKYQTTLVEDVSARTIVAFNETTDPFKAMTGQYSEDLATAHPLFARILRQGYQIRKIELVQAHKSRVFEKELSAVTAAFRQDGGGENGVAASDADALAGLGAEFAKAAAALQNRADNLFRITTTTPDEKDVRTMDKTAAGTLSLAIRTEPFQGENDPSISDEDIRGWINTVYWELARDPEFKGPVAGPNVAADTITFLPGVEAAPDLSGQQPLEPIPPLLTCDASKPDPLYESNVALIRAREDDDHSAEIPLISPGNFYLRATAFSKQDVPLARRTLLIEVAPAEIRGRLIISGGAVDRNKGQRIELNVGGFAWYRGDQATPHPSFLLYESGLFRAQLCGALSQILLQAETPPPGLFAPDDVASELLTTGYYHPRPGNNPGGVTNSNTVESALISPGVFGLTEPIEIILDNVDAVPVTVEAFDAADLQVADIDATVLANGDETEGPGPVPLDLTDGDELIARAAMNVLGGQAEGESTPVIFSVRDHGDGLTLRVDLPGYAKGNLQVSGSFKIPDTVKISGGVGGGTLWSNLLPDAGDQVLGARFGFTNADPVALENGLSLEGLMYANDKDETLLRASMPRRPVLPPGGVLDLGEIEVFPYATSPVDIKIRVTDWTGEPIPNEVRLTLDGVELIATGAEFTGSASFTGRAQSLLLRAEFDMLDGIAFAEHEIPINDIGDPLNPVSPATYELRVPVYDVGSLRITGSSEFTETPLTGETPVIEYKLGLQGQPPINTWSANVGDQFAFDPLFPIRVKDLLQLTGKTRIDRATFRGELTAPAPEIANGRPTVLDLGKMKLEAFSDFIQVPDLRNMPIEEAENRFGDDFVFRVHRAVDAPTPADAGKIYVQAPLPHTAEKPSLVPRGLYMNVGVYREVTLISLPDVSGDKDLTAQSFLIGLGINNVSILPARAASDGEIPGTVISQDPAAGTLINPKTVSVSLHSLKDPVRVQAQVRPDPEPEPDPPEPETEPPEPEPTPPPPPSVEPENTALGGWNGNVRITYIDGMIRSDDLNFSLTCSAAGPCAEKWVSKLTAFIEEELRKQEAAADDSLDITGAIVDGMADGIGLAILFGVALGGVPTIDVMFDGIDFGLRIQEDENGRVRFQIPEADDPLQFLVGIDPLSLNADGNIDILVKDHTVNDPENGTVRTNLTGGFTLSDPDTAVFEMEVRTDAAGQDGEAGNLTIRFAGDFVRGEPDFSPVSDKILEKITGFVDNPDPDKMLLIGKLLTMMDELTED